LDLDDVEESLANFQGKLDVSEKSMKLQIDIQSQEVASSSKKSSHSLDLNEPLRENRANQDNDDEKVDEEVKEKESQSLADEVEELLEGVPPPPDREDFELEQPDDPGEEELALNEKKRGRFRHRLILKFSNSCGEVLKTCVNTVQSLQSGNEGVMIKVRNREKKLKFYCRSHEGQTDILEFIFDGEKRPSCFNCWDLYWDREHLEDFTFSCKLKDLNQVTKKIQRGMQVRLEILNHSIGRKSKLLFTLQKGDQVFTFTLSKHNVQAEDPHLSQFRSLPESMEESQLNHLNLNASMHEKDALLTMFVLTHELKQAYEMHKGCSDTLSFAIIKDNPDAATPEEKYKITLKSKGSMLRTKSVIEPKGGRKSKCLIVRQPIEKNVVLQLPMNLLGKILSLKFINSTIKIDIHDHTVVRFIFRFKPQMAQGSLYYNIGQMNGENISGENISGVDESAEEEQEVVLNLKKRRKNGVVSSREYGTFRDKELSDDEFSQILP